MPGTSAIRIAVAKLHTAGIAAGTESLMKVDVAIGADRIVVPVTARDDKWRCRDQRERIGIHTD